MTTSQLQMQKVLDTLLLHFPRTTGKVDKIVKPYLALETDHDKCERIGQFAMSFPCVHTYFACREFRKGRLSIYFK